MNNKIKDGKTAFEFKRYDLAIPLFQKQIEKSNSKEEKSDAYYHLAMCNDKLNRYSDAIQYYNLAEESGYGKLASYKKAFVLKNMMSYKQAASTFESLAKFPELTSEVMQQKGICLKFANELAIVQKNVSIEPLMPNDNGSNYFPVVYDDNFLVYTTDGKEVSNTDVYEWTGKRYADIMIYETTSGEIMKFDTEINSTYNDGTPAFSKDYNTMVFTRCFNLESNKNDYCKLMISKRYNGLWSKPRLLEFTVDEVNYAHPCFFENDSILIFSAKPKGKDQFDLYYTEWDGETYVDPYPLPEKINSSFNEFFPNANGDTLYFSSDHTKGYGGLDIYKTYLKNGEWAVPTLLNYPYNSGADDFGLIIQRNSPKATNVLEQGYFSSSRANTGLDNIYKYKIYRASKDLTIAVIPPVKKDSVVVNKDFELYLAIKVTNANTKASLQNVSLDLLLDSKASKGITSKGGVFISKIDYTNTYSIKATKEGFLSKTITFNDSLLRITAKTHTINKEIELEPLERGKEIVLDNIYYDYEKWDIKKEAEPALNNLINILNDNPSISIELGSHTDCRGEDKYNEDLSQKRAQSAIEYLEARGINKNRLKAKGYGESQPSISCICTECNEDQHQINRRTSFKIL